MMKALTKSVLMSAFLAIAAPAYSSSESAIHIYECEFTDEGTTAELIEVTKAWIKAARHTKGGKDIDVAIRFPIAEGGDTGGDFRFIISAPNFAAWGAFTDAYEGSEVANVDDRLFEIAECGESTLWEGMVIK